MPGSAFLKSRSSWIFLLFAIIALGIASRAVHTGLSLFDKYLGDALYAAMVYAVLRLRWQGPRVAIAAAGIMLGIEIFQLTGIPADLVASNLLWVRLFGRLLGTKFNIADIFAYAIGIGCLVLGEKSRAKNKN